MVISWYLITRELLVLIHILLQFTVYKICTKCREYIYYYNLQYTRYILNVENTLLLQFTVYKIHTKSREYLYFIWGMLKRFWEVFLKVHLNYFLFIWTIFCSFELFFGAVELFFWIILCSFEIFLCV